MIKHKNFIIFCTTFCFAFSGASPSKIDFWQDRQKGANVFNKEVPEKDIKAAADFGIKFIRLSPDKFTSEARDFLLGSADEYTGLVEKDVKKLRQVLNICYEKNVSVVLTMLSLPGSRWKQNNNDKKDDLRIWESESYQEQAAKFWQDIAKEFKDHPAIVGYNILNEPHPERLFDKELVDVEKVKQAEVQEILYNFYDKVIKSIRQVDKETPIILDSSAYADPRAFAQFKPHQDPLILYAFHMGMPHQYTALKNGEYKYPGRINGEDWGIDTLTACVKPVKDFQKEHNIPNNRIFAEEFGGHRMSLGMDKYLEDLINILGEMGCHSAFYCFRADDWHGRDYELDQNPLPKDYWGMKEDDRKRRHIEMRDECSETSELFKKLKRSLETI